MLEQLIHLDQQLLLLGNSFHTAFADDFFTIFSGKLIWIPAVLAILYAIIRTERRDSIWTILFLILAVVLADQISSGVIKHLVMRPRPTHEPTLEGLVTIVHGYTGGKYGFVSSHAANACAVALFTSLLFRRWWYSCTISLWAVVNMYSRIYLGVHYPGDILGGIVVGLLTAWLAYYLLKRWKPQALAHADDKHLNACTYLIVGIVCLSVVVMSVFHSYWEMLS